MPRYGAGPIVESVTKSTHRWAPLLVAIACALLAAGCGPVMSESVRRDRVAQRASFDLDCQEEIEVATLIDASAYGAMGCGRRASYVLHRCGDLHEQSDCIVVLDGKSE